MIVYENIRKYRKLKGLTQNELADKVGYTSGSMITRIEKGEINLTTEKLHVIADALGVKPGVLMGWTEPSFDKDAGVLTVPFRGNKLDPVRKEIISLLPEADEDTLDDVLMLLRRHAERKKTSSAPLGGESLSC